MTSSTNKENSLAKRSSDLSEKIDLIKYQTQSEPEKQMQLNRDRQRLLSMQHRLQAYGRG